MDNQFYFYMFVILSITFVGAKFQYADFMKGKGQIENINEF